MYFCSLYKWLNHNTFINYLKDNIFRHFFKGLWIDFYFLEKSHNFSQPLIMVSLRLGKDQRTEKKEKEDNINKNINLLKP